MKADSIIRIKEILEQKRAAAHAGLNNIRYNMKERYGEDWGPDNLSNSEKVILKSQKQICKEMDELYADFMSHNWQG